MVRCRRRSVRPDQPLPCFMPTTVAVTKPRMALFIEPRKEMVGNRRKGEPGLLGTDGVTDQGGWPVLLRHELVAEFDHVATPSLCSGPVQ